jgi:hypothetical protein
MMGVNPNVVPEWYNGPIPEGFNGTIQGDPNRFNVSAGSAPAVAPMNQSAASAPTASAFGPVGDTIGGLFNVAGNFLDTHGSTIAGIGSIAGALDNASDVKKMGSAMQDHLQNMGNLLNAGSQFQGYGVTSGLGGSSVFGDGGINLGVGPDANLGSAGSSNMQGAGNAFTAALGQTGGQANADWNAVAQNQLGMANGINPNQGYAGAAAQDAINRSLADPSRRQAEIFDQLMAIQNPELARATAQQQAREHAMGRGGVAGSAYGGTAEDAAMAKARAQANAQAAVSAMQQADAERQMFSQMGSQYGQLGNQNYANLADRSNALANNAAQFGQLGNQADANATDRGGMFAQIGNAMGQLGLDQTKLSYLPMEMQMQLLDLSKNTGSMAQTGQLTGNDYLAQLLLGGVDANVNAQKVSSELMGNLYDSLLDNLGGTSDGEGNSASGIGGLLSGIGGLFSQLPF